MTTVNEMFRGQETYQDYNLLKVMSSNGVTDLKMSLKYAPQTDKNPEPAVLIHISGLLPNGRYLNEDVWPTKQIGKDDLAKFGVLKDGVFTPAFVPANIDYRVGYRAVRSLLTGELKVVESRPKWTLVKNGNDDVVLTGERRTFHGEQGEWVEI